MCDRRYRTALTILIGFMSVALSVIYFGLEQYIGRGELWFAIILFFLIVVAVLVRNLRNKGADFLELINPFLVIFAFYTMMLPINYLTYKKHFDTSILFTYLMISFVGLVSFIIGYYLPGVRNFVSRFPKLIIENRDLWIAAIVLLVIGIFSFGVTVQNFGGLEAFFTIGYGPQRYLIMRQQFTLGYGWEWIGLSFLLFLIAALIDRRRVHTIFLIVCIVVWVILSFWLGYRRPIVYMLVILFLAYNYLFHRLKFWPILVTGIVFYIILNAYGYTRSLLSEHGVAKALSETIGFAIRRPDLIMPVVTGEFNLVAESVVEIISSKFVQLKYGESYLVALLNAIPGIGRLIPGELLDLGEWRVITFHPGLYEAGAGLGFHPLAEGLVNFGVLGVGIHMMFYGLSARVLYEYLRNDSKNAFVVIMYAATVPIVLLDAVRSDFTSAFFKWSHCYFGPLALVMVFCYLVRSVTKRMYYRDD